MPGTTNRPTAEDLIAAALWGQDVGKVSASELQRRIIDGLVRVGYVIVHPDDVPPNPGPQGDPPGPDIPEDFTEEANYWASWWMATGYNNCLRRIFGDDQ